MTDIICRNPECTEHGNALTEEAPPYPDEWIVPEGYTAFTCSGCTFKMFVED
jgi:hypothetical protein